MKKYTIVGLCAALLATSGFAQDKAELKDDKDKLSYAYGMIMGSSFKRQSVDVNVDMLVRGLKDQLGGAPLALTENEARETLTKFQQGLMAKVEEKRKADGERNRKEGEEFLAANKTKPGVVALPSGLQYKVLKEGDGPIPAATQTVVANYRGTLINGTEFDSSYKRNQPFITPVTGVIKGWSEALQLMKVGSQWELYIPSNLAYGERGAGQNIGPNSTLVFEIELLEIKTNAVAAKPPAATPVTSDIIKVPSAEELKKGAKIEVIKAEDLAKLTNKPAATPEKK